MKASIWLILLDFIVSMVRQETLCCRVVFCVVLRWRPWGEKPRERAMVFHSSMPAGDRTAWGPKWAWVMACFPDFWSVIWNSHQPNICSMFLLGSIFQRLLHELSQDGLSWLSGPHRSLCCLVLFMSTRPPLPPVRCRNPSHPGTPSFPMRFLIHGFCGKHLVPLRIDLCPATLLTDLMLHPQIQETSFPLCTVERLHWPRISSFWMFPWLE